VATLGRPEFLDTVIGNRFPKSPFVPLGKTGRVDILVAGCGTGQPAIRSALKIKAAQVLAVDLSLSSLCFAQRQTRALGLKNIDYAQADILRLPSIGRMFDMIDATGVLHHLADPFAGWRALLSMLRPGGLMSLGLYSEIARRDVVYTRNFVAERGYRPTAEDIRRCRQELFYYTDRAPIKNVVMAWDFFSINECRDLLFHVCEHRLTLPEIAAFLAENKLQFLGFVLDPQTLRNYARQFPDDTAMTDLAQWHRFESENPYTFASMYLFWIQKNL
jgi:SAM-dependent methyltransferase